jgi:hypothetical protein
MGLDAEAMKFAGDDVVMSDVSESGSASSSSSSASASTATDSASTSAPKQVSAKRARTASFTQTLQQLAEEYDKK